MNKVNQKELLQRFDVAMKSHLKSGLDLEHQVYYLNSRNRYRFILENLPGDLTGKKVLDVGVSSFTPMLQELLPDSEIWAMGLEKTAPGFLPHPERFISHNLESPDPAPGGPFDLLIFGEVIEHLAASPRAVLAKLAGLLRPGGRLMLTTPNFLSLGNRLKMLTGKNPLERIRKETENPGHFREYSMNEMVEYVEGSGLEIVEKSYPDYWNDPSVHLKLYQLQKVNPLKIYLLLVPFLLFKKAVSLVIPSTRYAIYLLARRPA